MLFTLYNLRGLYQIIEKVKYISNKDKKAFISSIKKIYGIVNKDAATDALIELKEKKGFKYPNAVLGCGGKLESFLNVFTFPDFVRRIMYTTNGIESLNNQVR